MHWCSRIHLAALTLGARVHGGFGSFIPLGIKIGLDAVNRLNAKPRELSVLYYDSDASPCASFADGIAIATYASVGQRTLTPETTCEVSKKARRAWRKRG